MKLFKKKADVVKEQDATQNKKKSTKANGHKNKHVTTGKKLHVWIFQTSLLVILFFAIACLLLEYLFITESEKQQHSAIKATLSVSVQQSLDFYLEDKLNAISNLSTTGEIGASLSDELKRQQINSVVKGLWRELDQFYIVPSSDLSQINQVYPELSFASIDLLRRAVKGEKVGVEAFKHQDEWLFQVAVKVTSEVRGSVSEGALLAIFDLSALKPLLQIPQSLPSGELAIVTMQDRVVLSQGRGDLQGAVYQGTQLAQWRIRYAPEQSQLMRLDRTLFWIILGGIGLLLTIAVFIICRININLIRQDLQLATQVIKASIPSEGPVPNKFVYGELFSMADASVQQARKLLSEVKASVKQDNKVKAQLENEEAIQIPTQEDRDAPLFDDDLLDLDVLSDAAADGVDSGGIDNDFDVETSAMVQELDQLDLDVPQSIFRSYDIRGIVNETLNEGIVELLGKSIATEALAQGQTAMCVGYDGRLSSVGYCEVLTKGIVSTGMDVIVVGQVPTPVLYFSTHQFETGSGVMITGSHNPSNYNGFKMMIAGNTLAGDDIQKLYNRIILQDFSVGQGSRTERDVTRDYLDTILNDIAVAAPLKVVLDAGNGVAGGIAPELIEELGCEVIPLYCEVDGNFPNHHPDPGKPENLQDLIAAVKEHDADIGLAFDGDGDRLGVVTNTGKIIWPDRLLMLFARDVVSRNPGADIIFDVKCSRRLNGLISSYGGRPVMWKTGHSLIKAKMKETGALLAGEMSGHIFFKERWYGFDDGLYSAARLLEVLGIEDKTSDEVFAGFPEDVSTPEINITVTDESKFDLVDKLCALKDQFVGGNISTIDGLRVDFPNGWGLCRASNTTPVLVLRFEADDDAALEEIKQKFITQLKRVDPTLDCDF